MTNTIADALASWKLRFSITTTRSAPPEAIARAVTQVGSAPPELLELWSMTNGMAYEWFSILPVEDSENLKKTWNSITRINKKHAPRIPPELVIFATIGQGEVAYYHKLDNTLWFDDNKSISKTDHTFISFIDACLRDVDAQ